MGTAQRLLHYIPGFELGALILKPDYKVICCQAYLTVFYACLVQCIFHGIPGQIADFGSRDAETCRAGSLPYRLGKA